MPTGGLGLMAAWMAMGAMPQAAQAQAAGAGQITAFPLRDVRLLDSPFLQAQQRSIAYLLSLDPDRLLHGFRVNAGLPAKAPVYGGWESEATWTDIHCQGHSLGHFLSGVALMHAATGDDRFKRLTAYVVDELAACQKASNSGLLCAFPEGPKLVADFIAGEKISGVPWYTMHKVYAGLRDAYQQTDNQRALDVLTRYADWAIVATRALPEDRFQTMLDTEHGGMNEVYADLFAITGKAQYQEMARRFSHKAVLVPLTKSQDHLDGMHANTQIPKIVGFQRIADVSGDKDYTHAADFFWRSVVHGRSYATGGHGDNEHFYPMVDAANHVFSPKTSETCGMYNMLKLTKMLFLQQPRADYAEFYERALYNGILASQDPASGMVTYFQGSRPGYMKLYCTPVDSFWCCTGTGMENHAKYGESIYFHDDKALYVNLFIPSRLNWAERGAVLTQTTSFPAAPTTRLRWTLTHDMPLAMKLRHPVWSPTLAVHVNGKPVARSTQPGSYLTVDRMWKNGDTVELVMAMHVVAVPLPASPDLYALTYGPLVLSAALGSVGIAPGSDLVVNERKIGSYLNEPFTPPRLTGEMAVVVSAVRPASQPLHFTVADAQGKALALKPYYQVAHERYATYWTSGVQSA
jgi:DUF1680 family protein